MKHFKSIAPDYPRIGHLVGSMIGHDDFLSETWNPSGKVYSQEKVDGANCGMAWVDGPLLRNRDHILRKGYDAKTPAKKQFVPAWNWLHEHEKGLKTINTKLEATAVVYGEWLLVEHSIWYDRLPNYFLAYDIWDSERRLFLSPKVCERLLEGTGIFWIKAKEFSGKVEVGNSEFRTGLAEGIVLKEVDLTDEHIVCTAKYVRPDFVRVDNWNDRELRKNKLIQL